MDSPFVPFINIHNINKRNNNREKKTISVFSPILSDVQAAAPTWRTEATTLGMAMVLAVLCALLAGAFVRLTAALYRLKKRHHHALVFRRPFLSVAAVVLATALAVYPPLVGASMGRPLLAAVRSLFAPRAIADRTYDWGPFHPLAALAFMLVARFVFTAAASSAAARCFTSMRCDMLSPRLAPESTAASVAASSGTFFARNIRQSRVSVSFGYSSWW